MRWLLARQFSTAIRAKTLVLRFVGVLAFVVPSLTFRSVLQIAVAFEHRDRPTPSSLLVSGFTGALTYGDLRTSRQCDGSVVMDRYRRVVSRVDAMEAAARDALVVVRHDALFDLHGALLFRCQLFALDGHRVGASATLDVHEYASTGDTLFVVHVPALSEYHFTTAGVLKQLFGAGLIFSVEFNTRVSAEGRFLPDYRAAPSPRSQMHEHEHERPM